jgi:hypothetical protein
LSGVVLQPLNFTVRRAMSKVRATILAVVSGVVGLVVGVVSTAWFMSPLLNYAAASSSVAALVSDGAVLQEVHSGGMDAATRLLQMRLDGELMVIRAGVRSGVKLTPQAQNAIAQIRHLRESSGYEPPDPSVRRMVDEALALGTSNE